MSSTGTTTRPKPRPSLALARPQRDPRRQSSQLWGLRRLVVLPGHQRRAQQRDSSSAPRGNARSRRVALWRSTGRPAAPIFFRSLHGQQGVASKRHHGAAPCQNGGLSPNLRHRTRLLLRVPVAMLRPPSGRAGRHRQGRGMGSRQRTVVFVHT